MAKKKLVYVFSKLKTRVVSFEWIFDSRIGRDYDLSFVVLEPGPSEFSDSLRRLSSPRAFPFTASATSPARSASSRAGFARLPRHRAHHLLEATSRGSSRRSSRACRHHSRPRTQTTFTTRTAFTTGSPTPGHRHPGHLRERPLILTSLEGVPDHKIHVVSFGLPMADFPRCRPSASRR